MTYTLTDARADLMAVVAKIDAANVPTPTPDPVPVPTPVPVPVPTPTPAPVPVGDAAALLAAIAQGGTVKAGPGTYGVLKVNGLKPVGGAVVICDPAAHFERIVFAKGSSGIHFVSPRVWPDQTAPATYGGVVEADASTTKIIIEDALVMSAADGHDYLTWDAARWAARRTNGIVLNGSDSETVNCTLKAVRIGVVLGNDRSVIRGLKIRGISEDSWRVIGDADDCLISGVDSANFVKYDSTHADGGQSWSFDASKTVGTGDIANMRVEDILFREWIGPANHPLRRYDMQGIGFHDGHYSNMALRNVEVWTSTYNGIRVAKFDGLTVENCRVYDMGRASMDRRIHLIGNNFTIKGCVAGKVLIGGTAWTAAQMAAAGVTRPDYATLPAMPLVD